MGSSISERTIEYLKAWMMSPEHVQNPYPSEEEKDELIAATGIEKKQLTCWFSNNRKRFWKPKMDKLRAQYGLGENESIPAAILAEVNTDSIPSPQAALTEDDNFPMVAAQLPSPGDLLYASMSAPAPAGEVFMAPPEPTTYVDIYAPAPVASQPVTVSTCDLYASASAHDAAASVDIMPITTTANPLEEYTSDHFYAPSEQFNIGIDTTVNELVSPVSGEQQHSNKRQKVSIHDDVVAV